MIIFPLFHNAKMFVSGSGRESLRDIYRSVNEVGVLSYQKA